MERIIRDHYKLYPKSMICDWFKLVYQTEFGNAHMTDNVAKSMEWLKQELSVAVPTDIDKVDIGNGYTRINLGWLKESGLSLNTFNRIIMLSRNSSLGTSDGFWEKISIVEECIKKIPMNINLNEFYAFEQDYLKKGLPVISHSDIYKEEYKPSYRVVRSEYADKMDLWILTDKLVENAKKNGTTVNIAIDGMCGSGKTELSKIFKVLFDCNVIHMDDFFLKKQQCTYNRFLHPGGNIDYERFKQEVVDNLMTDTGFIYFSYDCHTNTMNEKKIAAKPLNIIEGAYSMHPYFGNIYNVRIFMETDKVTQLDRILSRNGEEELERFKKEWIPLENTYIRSYNIKEKCQFVYRT